MPEIPGSGVFREALEHERTLQRELVARVLAPVDAVFDVLEQSGAALREEAVALEHAATALQQAALIVQGQAGLYERAVGTLRTPSRTLESLAGVERPRT